MTNLRFEFALVVLGPLMISQPVGASEWSYGCKGAVPVFNENTIIMFDRERLVLLPKSWLKGTFRDLGSRDAADEVVEITKAVDENSGLAPTMVFVRPEHPDQKVTLTEKASRKISDVQRRAGRQPRNEHITIYKKIYRYVSDLGYAGPFDIEMDCINYELSAPIR